MVINRVGQRYQQRRQTGGGQFADGQCACAADHQIGPAIGLGHVLDERRYLRLDAHVAIALGGDGVMILARLMKHFGLDVLRQLGQRLGQQLVQRLRTQATAQHQQTSLASGQCLARCFEKQLDTHRVAGGTALGRGGKCIRERLAHAAGERRQTAVGSAGNGILLVDDQRHAS